MSERNFYDLCAIAAMLGLLCSDDTTRDDEGRLNAMALAEQSFGIAGEMLKSRRIRVPKEASS